MSTLRRSLLAGLLSGAVAQTYGAVEAKAGCKEAVGCAGYYRAFAATTSPLGSTFGPPSTVTGISLGAVGVQAATNGNQGVARVDVAGFKFKTPADTSDDTATEQRRSLSFYFGYLGATGAWDNVTRTGAVLGAAAEIASTISSINVFYDRDGVEGFQWDLADASKRYDVFNCNATVTTYDCIDVQGGVDMKTLVWTPLTRSEVNCSSVLPAGNYEADCKINTLTTQGELASNPGVAVLSITARTVSQPMMINGVEHNPDKAKWDVRVNYPWANRPNLYDAPNAKVALIAVHAGKAGAAGVGVKDTAGTKSLTFAAAGAVKAAYFAYIPKARIANADTDIKTQTITVAEINAFDCLLKPCMGTPTADLTNGLKLAFLFYQAFGWQPQITVHSFATVHPGEIVWDPEVGVQSTGGDESGAEMVVPGILAMLVACLFY